MIATWRNGRARGSRAVPLRIDGLEERVVLSHLGPFAARFAHVSARGPATVAAAATTATTRCDDTTTGTTATASTSSSRGTRGVRDTQLATDLTTLRTDQNAVLAASTVTDAQRYALRTDLRTIAQAGFRIDRTALGTVTDTLLTSLADGTYDSDATKAAAIKTSFNALFTGSTITQTQIDQTFTDFVAVARGLNISTTQLNKLSADRAAIQADLTRLGISNDHLPGSNLDLVLGGGGGFGGRGPRGRR